jgi:hypothetical protein
VHKAIEALLLLEEVLGGGLGRFLLEGQLSSFAMIVAEHPSESLAPLDCAVEFANGGGRLQ